MLAAPPVIAVALLALGLRVGGGSAMRGAIVFAAPPPMTRTGLAWQVLVAKDDHGARETLANVPLDVHIADAQWTGATNADGVAEVTFARPDLAAAQALDVTVTSGPELLARGTVRVPDARPNAADARRVATSLPAQKREGAIHLDALVRGGALLPGTPSALWVRATDAKTGAPVEGATVTGEPDAGVTFTVATATTCANGWAELKADPQVHVVATGLAAEHRDGRKGTWFGQLPVAYGGAFVALAPTVPAAPLHLDVLAPSADRVVYVEIDDVRGRAFATSVTTVAEGVGFPHAPVTIPALGEGLYWLVTSGDPRGAETLGGATVARPFLVRTSPVPVCDAMAELSRNPASPFPREVALDGLVGAHARADAQRKTGLTIALSSLAIAAILETALITHRARKAKARALQIVIGICIALMGFALLALLAMARPT